MRQAAVYLLGLYHDAKSVPKLVGMLNDANSSVRARTAQALVGMKQIDKVGQIDDALGRESHGRTAMVLVKSLAELGAVDLLAARLRDMRTLSAPNGLPPIPVRILVLHQLAESRSLAAAHAVVPVLADPLAAVQAQALRTLERLTNRTTADLVMHRQGVLAGDGVTASIPLQPVEMVAAWQRFLESIPSESSHDDVLLDGFRSRGLPIYRVNKQRLDPLAVALSWEAPYRENAARLIARAIDYHPEQGRGARAQPRMFWMRFLSRRRMIDSDAVAHGILAAELQVAGQMSLLVSRP